MRLLPLLLLAMPFTLLYAQDTTTNVNTVNDTTYTSTNTNTNVNTNTSTNTNLNTNVNTSTSTNTNNNYSESISVSNNTNNNNNYSESISVSNNTNTNNSTMESTSTNTNYNISVNENISDSISNNRNLNINESNSTTNSNSVVNSVSDSTSRSQAVNENTNRNVNENRSVSESVQTQNINQKMESPPPSAIAPSIGSSFSQDLCTTGVGGAVQTQLFGISGGKSVTDTNCERIKLSKTLYDMGMRVAAVSLMCQDDRVFMAMKMAGTPCPYEGKIGDEAGLAWDENPQRVPDGPLTAPKKLPRGTNVYTKEEFCEAYPNESVCSTDS